MAETRPLSDVWVDVLPPPDLAGWLKKFSRSRAKTLFSFVKNWQTRYVIITCGRLYYYKDVEKKEKQGVRVESDYSDHRISAPYCVA
jgi:hypothetical protein